MTKGVEETKVATKVAKETVKAKTQPKPDQTQKQAQAKVREEQTPSGTVAKGKTETGFADAETTSTHGKRTVYAEEP